MESISKIVEVSQSQQIPDLLSALTAFTDTFKSDSKLILVSDCVGYFFSKYKAKRLFIYYLRWGFSVVPYPMENQNRPY